MLAMLSYTEKVWTVGFRLLIKPVMMCVEIPYVMVPWHIHVTNTLKYYPPNVCGMCSFNGSNNAMF